MKVAVDLNDPGQPDPESVNKGYNEELDRPRPSSIDQWLELSASLYALYTPNTTSHIENIMLYSL
jgi:hypothetical protein